MSLTLLADRWQPFYYENFTECVKRKLNPVKFMSHQYLLSLILETSLSKKLPGFCFHQIRWVMVPDILENPVLDFVSVKHAW